MKKLIISQLMLLLMLAFLSACKSDSNPAPVVLTPNTDGVYVYGSNTIAADPTDPAARMSLAVMDSSHSSGSKTVDGVYGKFMYIGANSTISFASVTNKVGTIYGSDGPALYDSAQVTAAGKVTSPYNSQIKDNAYHGALKTNGTAVAITTEGLYYAVIDMNTMTFVVASVKPEVVGDAPYFSYSKPNTFLLPTSVTKTGAVFKATGVKIASAEGYLYRLNYGYAFYGGPNFATHSFLAQMNYGVAWASGSNTVSMFYAQNLANVITGVFTLELDYDATTDTWKEIKTKTGEIPTDYSNVSVGLEGNFNSFNAGADSAGFHGDGVDTYQIEKPTVSGTVYTWSWSNVAFDQNKNHDEFIFLQDGTWGHGLQIDATGATNTGAAFTNGDVISGPPNYHVVNGIVNGTGPTYDIKLIIDGSTNAKTVNIVRH